MNEVELINIFKRCSGKKIEIDKITSVFIECCDLVTFSTFLVWSKLNAEGKYKKLGNG